MFSTKVCNGPLYRENGSLPGRGWLDLLIIRVGHGEEVDSYGGWMRVRGEFREGRLVVGRDAVGESE